MLTLHPPDRSEPDGAGGCFLDLRVVIFQELVCYTGLVLGLRPANNNNNDMFISYSWCDNEMVQIQMENMPKNYNTHASYISSTQSDEGTYSLVLQTICKFNITVQQYLITCNFPNQIRQFGRIKHWQVITIVFTCCELFYRSYSITCFNINSAGSVFAQIIIGAVPQPADAFYILTNCALPTVVTVSADVADKFHVIVLTLWNSIIKFCKSTHDLVTQWGCLDQPWEKPWPCCVRQMPGLADCCTPADIKLKQRFCFDTPCLATIQMATFSNKVTFLKTYFFVITQIGCYDVT